MMHGPLHWCSPAAFTAAVRAATAPASQQHMLVSKKAMAANVLNTPKGFLTRNNIAKVQLDHEGYITADGVSKRSAAILPDSGCACKFKELSNHASALITKRMLIAQLEPWCAHSVIPFTTPAPAALPVVVSFWRSREQSKLLLQQSSRCHSCCLLRG